MEIMNLPYDGNVEVFTPVEGAGIIAKCCKRVGFVVKGRKKARKFYNVIMTFDIETSKILHNNELHCS